MITVTLSEQDSQHVDAVRAMVERESATNPNLNGASVAVETGDYTFVETADEYVGAALLADVNTLLAALRGETD